MARTLKTKDFPVAKDGKGTALELSPEVVAYIRELTQFAEQIEFETGSGRIFQDLLARWPTLAGWEDEKVQLCFSIAQYCTMLAESFLAQAVRLKILIAAIPIARPDPAAMANYLTFDATSGVGTNYFLKLREAGEKFQPSSIASGITVLCQPLNYQYHTLHEDYGRRPRHGAANLPNRQNRSVDAKLSKEDKYQLKIKARRLEPSAEDQNFHVPETTKKTGLSLIEDVIAPVMAASVVASSVIADVINPPNNASRVSAPTPQLVPIPAPPAETQPAPVINPPDAVPMAQSRQILAQPEVPIIAATPALITPTVPPPVLQPVAAAAVVVPRVEIAPQDSVRPQPSIGGATILPPVVEPAQPSSRPEPPQIQAQVAPRLVPVVAPAQIQPAATPTSKRSPAPEAELQPQPQLQPDLRPVRNVEAKTERDIKPQQRQAQPERPTPQPDQSSRQERRSEPERKSQEPEERPKQRPEQKAEARSQPKRQAEAKSQQPEPQQVQSKSARPEQARTAKPARNIEQRPAVKMKPSRDLEQPLAAHYRYDKNQVQKRQAMERKLKPKEPQPIVAANIVLPTILPPAPSMGVKAEVKATQQRVRQPILAPQRIVVAKPLPRRKPEPKPNATKRTPQPKPRQRGLELEPKLSLFKT